MLFADARCTIEFEITLCRGGEKSMFAEDIIKLTKDNTNYRKVLHTGVNSQLVAMSILEGQDIGEEVHPIVDAQKAES